MAQMKDCPLCGEQILVQAVKCKHCKSDLAGVLSLQTQQPQPLQATGQASSAQQNEKWEDCPKCTCKVPPNIKRCPHCNTDLKPGCWKAGLGCLGILVFLLGILLSFYSIFS